MSEGSVLIKFLKENASDLVKEKIYNQPHSCRVILRELNILSQHIINRILFIDENIRISLISSWVKKENLELLNICLRELIDLRIFYNQSSAEATLKLNRTFQDNVKFGLFGGKSCDTFVEYTSNEICPKEENFLMTEANRKWESILSIVTCSSELVGLNSISYKIVSEAQYIKNAEITNEGFQFLLLPRQKQLWKFLVAYLTYKSDAAVDIFEILCHLGSVYVEKFYRINKNLNQNSFKFLNDLSEFGLITYLQDPSSINTFVFQPTPMLIDLIAGRDSPIDEKGHLFVLSNETIYSKTDSHLHLAILKMFCEIDEVFPFAIVGRLTNTSIRKALDTGITGSQIIEYLKNNSHIEAKKAKAELLPHIVDKIRMLECNMNRVKITPGYLYREFANNQQFEMLRDFAEKHKVLLWAKGGEKASMVVTEDSHNEVKRYYKKIKKDVV